MFLDGIAGARTGRLHSMRSRCALRARRAQRRQRDTQNSKEKPLEKDCNREVSWARRATRRVHQTRTLQVKRRPTLGAPASAVKWVPP